MAIDCRVYPHFFADICQSDEVFRFRQETLNIHKNSPATLQHVANQMRLASLDRLVLMAQDERSVDGRVSVSNAEIKQLIDLRPDMFFGFASVDPASDNAEDDLERAFNELKLNGLILNLQRLGIEPSNPCLKPLIECCVKHDKPIIFDCGISYVKGFHSELGRPIHYEYFALHYPQLRFCLSRCAWPWTQEAAALLMKYPNVYMDTGVMYFDSAQEFYRYLFEDALQKTWVERSLRHQILFASENPRFEQIRMAKALRSLGFSKKTEDLLMGDNALAFMGVTL